MRLLWMACWILICPLVILAVNKLLAKFYKRFNNDGSLAVSIILLIVWFSLGYFFIIKG